MSDDSDTLKILVATDSHVGYLESDEIRGEDSYRSFEEVLMLAQEHAVDLILLGGDLFHDNQPSTYCMQRVIELLNKYCLGDKPCAFYIASDQAANFDGRLANVYDPNMNISYPVFSIHGNHDDPAGFRSCSPVKVLSCAGLLNYFGRSPQFERVRVSPVLIGKGETKLALYGLGNIRDERLHRAWRDGRVTFVRPEEPAWRDDAFNLLTLHQNRARHSPTSHIPEEFLDAFLDLVLWGHEHECRIDPEHACNGADIIQPGSSVATSLSEGEAEPKHVGLLKITRKSYFLNKIPLSTVRPFKFTTVVLSQVPALAQHPSDTKQCTRYLTSVVNDLIMQAAEDNPTMLPLIRVRIDYSGGFETFNTALFGRTFHGRVANPKDILSFFRKRIPTTTSTSSRRQATPAPASATVPSQDANIETLLTELLGRDLHILPENELIDAVQEFVDKGDKDAIARFVDRTTTNAKRTMEDDDERGHVQDLSDDYVKRRALTAKELRYAAYARERSGRI